jgi:TonB family protein
MSSTTQSFAWSLALHLSCGAAMLLVVAQPLREITPAILPGEIINLVQSPQPTPQSGSIGDTLPSVSMPELPRPVYKPAPAAEETEPAVQNTASIPVARPTARPSTPSSPSKSEHMTIDRYRQLHGIAGNPTRKPAIPTTQKIRKINPGDFAYSGAPAASSNNLSPSANSAIPSGLGEEFLAGLLAELQRSYADHEVAFAGLCTEVEFTVGDNGRLNSTRLITSSGSGEFDQAVMAALQRVRLNHCPAEAVGRSIKANFRVPNP